MDRFLDTPIDAYRGFVEAHCIAPIILSRALIPEMLARGGGTIIRETRKRGLTSLAKV